MNAPLHLTNRQRELIRRTAASLPTNARDAFLDDVTKCLAGTPTDNAVVEAVNVVLDRAISTPAYLCDAKPEGLS